MTDPLIVPPASAAPHEHADWLELQALKADDRGSSLQDLVQEIRRSGTTDAIGDPEEADYRGDSGAELSQVIAEEVFGEIEYRWGACGGEGGNYPFDVGEHSFVLKDRMESHPYIFFLLLARYGHKAGPEGDDGARLFEDICAQVSESYFGGPHPLVKSRVFGFPRRVLPKGFRRALDQLCHELGEGGKSINRPRRKDQKDGKLDIVVWRDFYDQQEGKLIGFGNCATGNNWQEKLTELQPIEWCRNWMRDTLAVMPIKLFFVPHRVDTDNWTLSCIYAGILFDRCRITQHTNFLEPDLLERCAKWTKHVREHKLC